LLVTDGTLPILGVSPALGRLFSREDDLPGTPETVLLTYGYWQHKFGADPSAVGRNVMVDGKSRQIIGVLPQRFHFLDREDPAMFLPFKFDRNKIFLGNFSYNAVARLKPGVTITRASADVARMIPIVMRTFPAPPGFSLKLFEQAHIGPNLRPLKQDVVGDVGKMLWVLMGSIGMVLLIACANVANLLLARAASRRREVAIRQALGAGRGRLVRQMLTESLLLAVMGGAAGLLVASWCIPVLERLGAKTIPELAQVNIDWRVAAVCGVLSLLTGLVFGTAPALEMSAANPVASLR
jgi:predicted permease